MKFGVEIEFRMGDVRSLDRDICCAQAVLSPCWSLIKEVGCGLEAISPIYTDTRKFYEDAANLCGALKSMGAYVQPLDYVDAFHVHVDVLELGVPPASRLGLNYYGQLNSFNARWLPMTGRIWEQPPEGAEVYCSEQTLRRLLRGELGHHKSAALYGKEREGWERRPAINLHGKNRTLEARQHPGTLDPDEMVSWVLELYGLAQ